MFFTAETQLTAITKVQTSQINRPSSTINCKEKKGRSVKSFHETKVGTKRDKKQQRRRKEKDSKQIEATVHFDSKLVSREILERQFGLLFRPNFVKITRSSLSQTKWLTPAPSLKIVSVVVGL